MFDLKTILKKNGQDEKLAYEIGIFEKRNDGKIYIPPQEIKKDQNSVNKKTFSF